MDNTQATNQTERDPGAAVAPVGIITNRKRKKDRAEKMETEADVKRPSFPPLSPESLAVS